MNRHILTAENIDPSALTEMQKFHAGIVKEVEEAVKGNKIVVVGMKQNPVVKKVRQVLNDAGISFTYLEYGSYLKGWKKRLAIKLWSGWPTYPQVFVNGRLIGGCAETEKALSAGNLK